MKTYQAPKQNRAKESETRFLNALDELLRHRSYHAATIQDIADRASLHKGAFLKRFGTKRAALLELFERYCIAASAAMARGHEQVGRHVLVHELVFELSQTLEGLQRLHFSANRAMHEFFMETLDVAPQTKRIFRELVALMQKIQSHYFQDRQSTASGAYSAAQLMVTLNYNYVLLAMPAFPEDSKQRHDLIANLVICALQA